MIGTNGHKIEGLRRRFVDWRRERQRGTRIPEPLWRAAVEAAREHGVHRISKPLGVDSYSLARRVNAKPAASGRGIPFVELPGAILPASPACVVEIQDPAGRRLRVELRDAAGADAIARSLWESSRGSRSRRRCACSWRSTP